MHKNLVIIACSIFKAELELLKETGKINVPVIYLNSMLHMYPKKLQEVLDEIIRENNYLKIILAFGDCHARMVDYEENKNIVRTPGINCCEIFLGSARYRKIRNEGAFILLPEWANRYKEIDSQLLNEISEFVGLPLEIHNSSISELENTIVKLTNKHQNPDNDGK